MTLISLYSLECATKDAKLQLVTLNAVKNRLENAPNLIQTKTTLSGVLQLDSEAASAKL
jgi:hypothetical protein